MPPLHIYLEHVFIAIGEPKRSRQLRISLIKYKFIFFLASYPASSSWLLKLPIVQATWPFCSAVTSSFWLGRRREFAYLYFPQPFLRSWDGYEW